MTDIILFLQGITHTAYTYSTFTLVSVFTLSPLLHERSKQKARNLVHFYVCIELSICHKVVP
jgi:hypothetical protein